MENFVMIEHKHILIRAEVEWFYGVHETGSFKAWIKKLIENLGMKRLSGPHCVYVQKPGLQGWTGVCIIETSHLAIHVWDESKPILIQLDVYTCGPLDPNVVFDHLKEFNPSNMEYILFDREFTLDLKESRISLVHKTRTETI